MAYELVECKRLTFVVATVPKLGDVRRLMACWNAMDGIDQETLDMGWTGIGCMEAAHKHEERAAAFAKDIEILAKKLVDMNLTRVKMERQHTNLLMAFHSASSELTAARALIQQQDALLGKKACATKECVELLAARALLREVLEDADKMMEVLNLAAQGVPESSKIQRIRSYLGACDTLGGNSEVGL